MNRWIGCCILVGSLLVSGCTTATPSASPSATVTPLTRDEYNATCSMLLSEASSPEEIQEADEWCRANEPPRGTEPLIPREGLEQLTREQALAWWDLDPIFEDPEAEGLSENWFSFARQGSDLVSEVDWTVMLDTWYAPPETDLEVSTLNEIRASGGWALHSRFTPASQEPTRYGGLEPIRQFSSPVHVQGLPGYYWLDEGGESFPEDDRRYVYWGELTSTGDAITWLVIAHPQVMDRDEVVQLANGLRAIR